MFPAAGRSLSGGRPSSRSRDDWRRRQREPNLRRSTGLTLELSGHINREAIDWSAWASS